MRVMLLTAEQAGPARATVIVNPQSGKLYYNIWHGLRSLGFWAYVCTLNHKHFAPRTRDDVIELDKNNYALKPVMKKGDCLKDSRDNELYCICVDEDDLSHRKNILLFWEIPNINYINVKFNTTANAALLGEGSYGKHRGKTHYISPYPVLEIMGDCTLEWSAEDIQGNKITQKIDVRIHDTNTFTIHPIIKTEKEVV